MTQESPHSSGLALLAEAFRAKRTGMLVWAEGRLRVRLEAGQIVALGPAPAESTLATPMPKPNDSVRLRLERVLSEIGVIKASAAADPPLAPPPETLRDRLLERLADRATQVRFDEGSEAAESLVPVAVATEPLILEAVRQMRDADAVRAALGNLDLRLVATTTLDDERTLTLTEGYLLSRVDGLLSAREVLQIVPLDPHETERTLLGLVLTGRVECKSAPVSKAALKPVPKPEPVEAAPTAEPASAPQAEPPAPTGVEAATEEDVERERADEPVVEAIPDEEDDSEGVAAAAQDAPTGPIPVPSAPLPPDAATTSRRRDILEFFQSLPLKNHFGVLGVEPGCSDADARKAYVTLVKRYHPDSQRDRRLDDLHDILEAITIRVGEAWEVLGEARSRASYESKSGIVRHSLTTTQRLPAPSLHVPASAEPEPGAYVSPEDILFRARRLLAQARYWDAIQVLEPTLQRMEPRSQQLRGRLLLARAYSKNPAWLRRAEDMLQELMREDPTSADVHYELGLLYKTGGFTARAHGMFRRALELRPGHKEASAELGIVTAEPESKGVGLLKRLFKRGKAS